MTKEILDSNNLKATINIVCSDCWKKANKATQIKKFWEVKYPTSFSVSTFHKNTCDFCKQKKSVTQTRDFFYPDFNLIKK